MKNFLIVFLFVNTFLKNFCFGISNPLSVKDMTNRTIELENPANRVATFCVPIATTIIALDIKTDRLVGIHQLAKKTMQEGIIGEAFPKALLIADDISGNSFFPNIESLIKLNPDLVIQWGHRGEDIYKPIMKAGLKTLLLTYGDEKKGREFMRVTAQAIAKTDRISKILDWRTKVQEDIENKATRIKENEKPNVLYIPRALNGIHVGGTGIYMDFWINLSGGKNAASKIKNIKPINSEEIIALDPDVIFLGTFEEGLTTSFVYSHPVLSRTKAAKSNRVYKIPIGGERWDPPNQESPLAWMWVANLLHPKIFDYPLRKEIIKSFMEMYQFKINEDGIDKILRMKMQSESANYNIFKSKNIKAS